MRLDKFLKVSRIIKRRTVAKELADHDRIKVNGSVAKPATEIEINDIIEITYGTNINTFKVLELKDHIAKDDASIMYELISNRRA